MTAAPALAPCSVYASPRWLEVQTRGGRPPGRVLTAPDASGAPRAWLPLHDRVPTRNPRYALATLCRGFPAPPPAARYVGLTSGYQTDIATIAGADVLPALVAEALALAPTLPVIVPYATDRLAQALRALAPGAPCVLEAGDAWLRATADSFPAWVAALPKFARQDVHRDERKFAAAGLTESVEPLAGEVARFAELVSLHAHRYGLDEPVAALTPHLAAIAEVFGDDALLFAARRGGRLVAAALGLVHGDHVYLRMVGNDHAEIGGSSAHFVLSFYRPLAWAIARGLAGLHLGLSADRTKRSRGAVIEPLWTVVLGALPAPVDAAAVSRARLVAIAADDDATADALAGRLA